MEFTNHYREFNMSTIESLNAAQQLASVRLVASTNQSGTYFNGSLNNGVGATFTYATGALTIDSVAVNINDYVLLAGQTNGFENGIYQCTVAGATGVSAKLTRRGDFQCIEQMRQGAYVPVEAGTAFGGSMWTLVEPMPAAIGAPLTATLNDINFNTITAAGSSLYLQVANNLSDVSDALVSRTNLGLGITTNNYAAVAITAAEFNGMYAAPKLLVAAPGANRLLVLDKMDLLETYNSAAFAAGGVAAVQYDSTINGAGVIASTTVAAAAFQVTASTGFVFNGGVVPQTFSTCVNKGFYLSNITGAFTTGNSTFVAHIWYKNIPTT
jgi:hypothetical protein